MKGICWLMLQQHRHLPLKWELMTRRSRELLPRWENVGVAPPRNLQTAKWSLWPAARSGLAGVVPSSAMGSAERRGQVEKIMIHLTLVFLARFTNHPWWAPCKGMAPGSRAQRSDLWNWSRCTSGTPCMLHLSTRTWQIVELYQMSFTSTAFHTLPVTDVLVQPQRQPRRSVILVPPVWSACSHISRHPSPNCSMRWFFWCSRWTRSRLSLMWN